MKKLLGAMALCALGLAAAARADEAPSCPDGFRAEARDVGGQKMYGCVSEQVFSCSPGYHVRDFHPNKNCAAALSSLGGGKCQGPAAAFRAPDGQYWCLDPAMYGPAFKRRCPLSNARWIGGDQYRCATMMACPAGYRFGLWGANQNLCVGPQGFSCGAGYQAIEVLRGRQYCGSVKTYERNATCDGGKTKDKMKGTDGLWHCVEPKTDHCPGGRKHFVGVPVGDTQFHCLMVSP